MSYSPTTWENGNIITASALNKIEQGIADASSGGGSSDQWAPYDGVVNIYHDNSSNSNYQTTLLKGTYSDIASKLYSGTTPPKILVLVRNENSGINTSGMGTVVYYGPSGNPPFFDVAMIYTTASTSSATSYIFSYCFRWQNTNNIIVL